jgi:hypothetical protein
MSDAETPDDSPVPSTGPTHEVDDPEEYVNTRRLRDLFDARQTVREDRRKAKDVIHFESGDGLRDREVAALTIYRQSVETYILESKSLLTATDRGTALWADAEFGKVRLELETRGVDGPAKPELFDPTGEGWVEVPRGEAPEPTVIPLSGLSSLLRIDDPVTRTWNFTVTGTPPRGSHSKSVTGREQPSWQMLDQMVVSLNDYLSSLGIDLSVQEETGEPEWDYSDMV